MRINGLIRNFVHTKIKSVPFLLLLLILQISTNVLAHEGHSHSSTSISSTSSQTLDIASTVESPLTLSIKTRLGYENESYGGVAPAIYSYFGNEDINAKLAYEYRYREFSSNDKVAPPKRENNQHVVLTISKSISEDIRFFIPIEFEQNQLINASSSDYEFTIINPTILIKGDRDVNYGFGYSYTLRNYPNGTLSVPLFNQSGSSEPITPSDLPSQNVELIQYGVKDAEHDLIANISTPFGKFNLQVEGRYILNYSTVSEREFRGNLIKLGVDSPLWKRATGTLYFSQESRKFNQDSQQINVAEVNIAQELSPKTSIVGIAKYNQIKQLAKKDWIEGYAQLQFIF